MPLPGRLDGGRLWPDYGETHNDSVEATSRNALTNTLAVDRRRERMRGVCVGEVIAVVRDANAEERVASAMSTSPFSHPRICPISMADGCAADDVLTVSGPDQRATVSAHHVVVGYVTALAAVRVRRGGTTFSN